MTKYPSTLLPSREGITELRKAVLDLLCKINAEAQYAYDHGLGLWLRDDSVPSLTLVSPYWLQAFRARIGDAFILNSGYIGVGTSSPASAIHISQPWADARVLLQRSNSVVGGSYGVYAWANYLLNYTAAISSLADTFNDAGRLEFKTAATGGGYTSPYSVPTRMAILPNGRVGINTTAPNARLEAVAPVGEEAARFGDGTNRSAFERDGTLRFDGNATVFNDIFLPLDPKTTGAGKPTLRVFSGAINQYTMAVNDVTEIGAAEFLHDWKEGTPIEIHVHWATNGVDATARAVKWEVSYTWANRVGNGAPEAFPAATVRSAETAIPANTVDKTHFRTSVTTFTPSGGKIGANIVMALKRIASTGTAPTNDPWVFMVGIHYEIDTIGSRTISAK